jgi:pimeloyl-[acyl-carrier protein] methyl ester esterase
MAHLIVEDGRGIYFEHHAGEGPPVVLVHGWSVTGRCWDTFLPHLLGQGLEVVVVDERACGRSDKDFRDVSIGALASDVVRLVDELDLRRPVLNGWSLGGAVVAEAGARLGDRLGGLVLTCAATPRFVQGDGWPYGDTREGLAATVAGIRDDRVGGYHGVAIAAFHDQPSPEVIDWVRGMFLEAGPRVFDSLLDLGDIDQRETLPRIPAPALVIGGTDDVFVPLAAAEEAAGLLPSGRLVSFEGCGHTPFLEAPERYRAEVLTFVEELAAPGVR